LRILAIGIAIAEGPESAQSARSFRSDVRCRFVLAQRDRVTRVTKQSVGSAGQIGDLGDELRLDPVDAGEHEFT
jgi:hypothetical protein